MNKRFFAALILSVMMGMSLTSFAAPTAKNSETSSTGQVQTDTQTQIESTPQPQSSDTDESNSESEETSETEQTGEQDISGQSSDPNVYMEDNTLTPPEVNYAQSALLMDMSSGRLLYGKNIDQRLYPASTTKIMTGILAIEMGNMDEVVTASYEAIKPITMEDSHMGILTGEEMTFEQYLIGMLVYSANDAANVIAVHLAGSIEGFADIMNQKAAELGMTNTHFENPCGTHNDNHYTTARDLAILSQYAMKNEKFREIVKMPVYKIAPTNKYKTERVLVNTNLFLSTSRSVQHYYPPCNGIKTGHTSESGYCLVSSAQYNDTELLAVVMKCENTNDNEGAYSYIDSKTLFNFGFDNYVNQVIANPGDIVSDSKVKEAKNDIRVALTVDVNVNALVPSSEENAAEIITNVNIPDELYAPINKGDVIGTVTYTYKGTQIGTANLVATNNVERNEILHILNLILKVITSPFFFIPAIIVILLIIFARGQKRKRDRQRRIQQLKKQKKMTPDRNASRMQRLSEETKGDNSRYYK